jgi:uncharacterized protein
VFLSSIKSIVSLGLFSLLVCSCDRFISPNTKSPSNPAPTPLSVPIADPQIAKLVAAGIAQTTQTRTYDPAYVPIAYPNGDVPLTTGVCTDVIIRAYRKIGIDLQQQVHEDMRRNFTIYPKLWDLKKPDPNIDHRRVANLMTFFQRKGRSLPVTNDLQQYQPGDLITFDLGPKISLHIGLITNVKDSNGDYQMVHNAGWGTNVETIPRSWKINGHYRYR